jgi:leucyl-tRNA synthetase
LIENTVEIAVQVDGKLRDRIAIPSGQDRETQQHAALASSKIQEFLVDRTIARVIVVPGRLVNIVLERQKS